MDGSVLSILLTGLLPDVQYTVAVAAVTSLGVGALSLPVSLLVGESLKPLQPPRSAEYGRTHSQQAELTPGESRPPSVVERVKNRAVCDYHSSRRV